MAVQSPSSLLVDFASQIDLSGHQYISQNGEKFTLTKGKSSPQHLLELIQAARAEKGSEKEINAAVSVIKSHLEKKISGLFSFLISNGDKARIRELIQQLGDAKVSPPTTEGEARLLFYQELPGMLRVRSAATKDLETIKIISKRLWDHFGEYEPYKQHMKLFFEGEHFLFEEQNDFLLYEELKKPEVTCAYLRGSSHYDHGTLNNKTGGPVPESADKVPNPQYEIEGPQVKALLLGRVKLAVNPNGELIFGRAAEGKEEASSRKFTFLQTEWAPDSDTIFSANFWKHRVFSFVLYAARKTLGCETPNVGPYGYGHGDAKQPTVISLKKPTV